MCLEASSICKAFALMSCPSAPTLKPDQIYSVPFIRPAWGSTSREHSSLLSLPSLFFQWFGIPTTRSTQPRISPSKMYEFRTTAVRYRKKNTTLKRPRLKKYQTKIQTTVILTVASQHGLSLPVFVSCFLLWLHNLIIPPPFSQAMCSTCST